MPSPSGGTSQALGSPQESLQGRDFTEPMSSMALRDLPCVSRFGDGFLLILWHSRGFQDSSGGP